MDNIIIKAYAKVNLSLSVGARESSGFHQIHSLIVPIDISDKVTVTKRTDGIIRVKCDGVPNERNTAVKAGRAFCDRFCTTGVDIEIEKGIPIGGGLGGSSADAAAVLNAMSILYDIEDFVAIDEVAAKIGKDVPAMLSGEAVVASGYGERYQSVEFDTDAAIVVVNADLGNDTALIYATFDDYPLPKFDTERAYKLVFAVNSGDISGATAFMKNDLALAAYTANPQMCKIRDELAKLGYTTFVTGSGSSQFILVKDFTAAFALAKKLSPRFNAMPARFMI